MTCIEFAYKGWRDSDADLVCLNRSSMDSSRLHRVRGDSGSRPNSPASVEGGQASYAPSICEQGQSVVNSFIQNIFTKMLLKGNIKATHWPSS